MHFFLNWLIFIGGYFLHREGFIIISDAKINHKITPKILVYVHGYTEENPFLFRGKVYEYPVFVKLQLF